MKQMVCMLHKICLNWLTHTGLYSDASLLITHINSKCEIASGENKKITNKTTQVESVGVSVPMTSQEKHGCN